MTFLELVQLRCSIRRYDAARPVEREKIARMLEAARLAPSACNSQPWSFWVVEKPTLKKQVAEAAFSGLYKMNAFAIHAPVLIVIARDRSKKAARFGGCIRGVTFNLIDTGIAGEHMCLQAAEDGLGTCWLGWFNEKAVRKRLAIPRHFKLDSIISVGYPEANLPDREKKRLNLDEITHYC